MHIPFQKKPHPEGRRYANVTRAPVYSYHASRSALPAATGRQLMRPATTTRQASEVLSYTVKRLGVVVTIFAVSISAVSLLMLSASPKVQPLNNIPPDAFLHSIGDYQQAAAKILASSPLSRTKLTINVDAVSMGLRQQFPELATVSVKLPLVGHRPIIYVQPAQPALVLSTLHAGAFLVARTGQIVGRATAATAHDMDVPLVVDQSDAPVSVGRLALPNSTVTFIQAVAYQLRRKHIGIASFTLPADSSELDVAISDTSYFVKFNLAHPASVERQIGTYLATSHYLQGQGTPPAQYIDVRIDGRAYYR